MYCSQQTFFLRTDARLVLVQSYGVEGGNYFAERRAAGMEEGREGGRYRGGR